MSSSRFFVSFLLFSGRWTGGFGKLDWTPGPLLVQPLAAWVSGGHVSLYIIHLSTTLKGEIGGREVVEGVTLRFWLNEGGP